MTTEFTEKEKPKTPLTEKELFEIWKQDEFWGKAGSYDCDPFTGKRTKHIEDK